MRDINNVLLCGMGAIGSIYVNILKDYAPIDFRVLVDKTRLERYTKNPIIYNGKILSVNYLLPESNNFKADLIIIATKMSGLNDALEQIKNFVNEKTIILPLLNGVMSEEIIASHYGREQVLYSYFIGHSSVRTGNSIVHDGVNKIVFGSDNPNDIESVLTVKAFFDKCGISYEIPEDIKHSLWAKFMLNVSSNPTTALLRKNFGQMLSSEKFMTLAVKIMKEVQAVAKAEGIKSADNLVDETVAKLHTMCPEGKTSMFQDVLAGRKTENDIFAGAVVQLGQKHNIPTPYCSILKEFFDIIDE